MTIWERVPAARIGAAVGRFGSDEGGAALAYFIMMMALMIISTGMAVDYMRHEMYRAALQDALDRGVLSAASMSQTLDPELVVEDYMRTAGVLEMDTERFSLNVTPARAEEFTGNRRRVTASGTQEFDTYFLKMIGYPTLQVAATATAEMSRPEIEISLVLDISGSMRYYDGGDKRRIEYLRPAAENFVAAMLEDGRDAYTALNLVPYAGHVNPGPELFALLNGRRDHDYSSCLELLHSDFVLEGMPHAGSYLQVPDFHEWPIDRAFMDWGWCPSDDQAIRPLSNDLDALVAAIEGLRLHDGTGTNNAMKWGMALIDPLSRPEVTALVDSGTIDERFRGLPAEWDDEDTRKYLVLMTDGQITEQFRPTQMFAEINHTVELQNQSGHPTVTHVQRDMALSEFYDMCDAAKEHGVTIFTIAFEAPAGASDEMRACASSESHFYEVSGLEIEDAFASIASAVSALKLTN